MWSWFNRTNPAKAKLEGQEVCPVKIKTDTKISQAFAGAEEERVAQVTVAQIAPENASGKSVSIRHAV